MRSHPQICNGVSREVKVCGQRLACLPAADNRAVFIHSVTQRSPRLSSVDSRGTLSASNGMYGGAASSLVFGLTQITTSLTL